MDFVYLHTAVETPTRFYSTLAWTSNRLFAQEQPTLQGIVGSFEEVVSK